MGTFVKERAKLIEAAQRPALGLQKTENGKLIGKFEGARWRESETGKAGDNWNKHVLDAAACLADTSEENPFGQGWRDYFKAEAIKGLENQRMRIEQENLWVE